MTLRTTPLTLEEANDLVERWHRHHKPCQGHRFSIGAEDTKSGRLHGCAIVGRPTGRRNPQYSWVEVVRLVADGEPHVCSFLYAACARIAKEMGFIRIQTFILESEPGTSLIAAGWVFDTMSMGGDWNQPSRGDRRVDQPQERKQRWKKLLR